MCSMCRSGGEVGVGGSTYVFFPRVNRGLHSKYRFPRFEQRKQGTGTPNGGKVYSDVTYRFCNLTHYVVTVCIHM